MANTVAGTTDRFDQEFLYQIKKNIKKNGQEQLQIKTIISMHKD